MVVTNLFSVLQARQYGHPRTRLWGAQLAVLRLRERWSMPRAVPQGSRCVKDLVFLGQDAFCLVRTDGRADAFSALPGTTGALQWLTGLAIFEGERVRMASHISDISALLTVYAAPSNTRRGRLFVRVLDVPALLRGEAHSRGCGSLADVSIPKGGFVEFDSQNHCIWADDGQMLRCWDASSFEQRFSLGPWGADGPPNVRFTHGLAGLLSPNLNSTVEIALHSSINGQLLVSTEVHVQPQSIEFVFLELINKCVLMKRRGCSAIIANLESLAHGVLQGTENWEPDVFVFLPSQNLALALFPHVLEIWCCAHPDSCRCIGTVQQVVDFNPHRFSVDERLAAALVVCTRPPAEPPLMQPWPWRHTGREGAPRHGGEELVLVDLLQSGGVRAVVSGACEGMGGGGGVDRVLFEADPGLLVLLSRRGGLSAYTSG